MQMTLRQMQIDRGVFQLRVPHQKLNRAQVGPGSPSGVSRNCGAACAAPIRLRDPGAFRASLQACQTVLSEIGCSSSAMTGSAGEQIDLGLDFAARQYSRSASSSFGRHRHFPVARTLALVDMDHHAFAIDVS